MPEVELRVGSTRHGGFRTGSATLAMDELAHAFELTYSDRFEEGVAALPIREGDSCQLLVDGEVLIDGYVDEADHSYDANRYDLAATGRSKTADLVDCSAVRRSGQWSHVELGKIATDLCGPFSIQVDDRVGETARFRHFTLQTGETALEALERAAQLRGVVLLTEGGNLVLTRAGASQTRTRIELGRNILSGRRLGSWAERFSDYIFKGQTRATDELNGLSASQLRHDVEDRAVTRYRPLIVQSTGQDGTQDLGKRAVLERNRRAGKSERLTYQVDGWHTTEGRLWRPNTLVTVDDPRLDVAGVFLVTAVTYVFDELEQGTGLATGLELTRPEAYDQVDYPAQRELR